MSGLFYKAEIVAVSITNTPTTSDIIECLCGATNPITIHRIELTSKSVQTNEQYTIQLLKRTTAGTGGSAGTVVPQADKNTVAAGLTTTLGRVTTVGTASTVYGNWDWNILIPFDEMNGKAALEIEIPAATRFSINITSQLAGTRVFNGAIFFEER